VSFFDCIEIVFDFLLTWWVQTGAGNSSEVQKMMTNDRTVVLLLLISILTAVNSSFNDMLVKNDDPSTSGDWWQLTRTNDTLFHAFNTSNIYLRTADIDESGLHSCYEYKAVSNLNQTISHQDTFCYPSIIITGYRKCSTSALYSLLSQYPGVMHSESKENCAFLGGRSIIQYFESLPRSVEGGKLLVDGCITLDSNMQMRAMLRQPNTFYIVRAFYCTF
jgi:hypothetical protein